MTDQSPPDFHLSRDQVAIEYGISKRFLELAAVKGGGPVMTKISKRMVRYRRADIEIWLASKRVSNTSEKV